MERLRSQLRQNPPPVVTPKPPKLIELEGKLFKVEKGRFKADLSHIYKA